MAKREYSNGLQHLKFMQRAKQREEAVKQAEEAADDSHWVVPVNMRGSGKRCAVVMEGDPKPGALLGRMSFQSCNASVDKLVEEAEAIHKRRLSAAKEKVEAASGATTETMTSKAQKEEDTTQAEGNVQFKKPKVGVTNSLFAGVGEAEWPNSGRNDGKTWQGWRGPGDYRMLKPPPKR